MLVPLSVQDLMVRDVETIRPDATVREVAERLREATVGSLVVTAGGTPVGIVTESDVVRLVARGTDPDTTTVEAVMSTDIVTTRPEATIEQAAETLSEHEFRRLPVVEDGELVGIVTTTDLSYYLPHLAHRERHVRPREPDVSPDTLYDEGEWEFEHEGTGDVSVGDEVRFRKRLSEEDVSAFAEASGDTNRLHLDEEFAAGTRFGGRIVHGTLVAGVVSAALARLPGLTIYLGQDLRFLAPVDVDETVTAVCEVVEELGDGKFEIRTAVYDEAGERVLDGEAVVLVDELPADAERAVQSAD